MSSAKPHTILCGGVKLTRQANKKITKSRLLKLEVDESKEGQNVRIGLPHFINKVNCHFPDRVKDLLELAGYIYAADRLIKRGTPDQLEYHNWSRNLQFHIKVRDFKFWNSTKVKDILNELLCFVSGDFKYSFTFHPGAVDIGQKSLFDFEGIEFENKEATVALFSGGLDSLAGALDTLENGNRKLILVSHQSNNSGVKSIQKNVYKLLKEDYGDRVVLFPFECNLTGDRATEETQRSRIFLYTSIAFSLAIHTTNKEINVFENGITSINISKRQDLLNARASRTTHPKVLRLLEDFFNLISKDKVKIKHPFIYATKADIFSLIKSYNKQSYINNTLSCTKTFQKFKNNSQASHCGLCSQCVDRRISAFATSLEDFDALYNCDLSKDPIVDLEGRSHLTSYLRFNTEVLKLTEVDFYSEHLLAISDLLDDLPGENHSAKANKLFLLYKSNALNLQIALRRLREGENILQPKVKDSLFSLIDDRVHLRQDAMQFIEKITKRLDQIIPLSFRSSKPNHENSLNDVINAHLADEKNDYEREFPAVRFSFSTVIPDHSFDSYDLFIESKYLRVKTAKSKITDEIAADISKYPEDKWKLFVVYDPERKIAEDVKFKRDFECKGKIIVHIVR